MPHIVFDSCVTITHIHLFSDGNQLNAYIVMHDADVDRRMEFREVSSLSVASLSYPMQIWGFQIVDHKEDGWSAPERYEVRDFEDNLIHFFCRDVIINTHST